MLLELRIKDYILIEDANIEFGPGLNVLTGETGAGKSMVVGALELLLGKKASAQSIRIGCDKAHITAVFDSDAIDLESFGVPDQDGMAILVREIRSDGKSIARVNGQPVPLQILRQVASKLFHIHGQNEQLELFSKDYQLRMLDQYSGHNMEQEISKLYQVYMERERYLNQLEEHSQDRSQKLDFLKFQCEEIRDSKLRIGEDEVLEREYEYYSSLEKIIEAVRGAEEWIHSNQVQDCSAVSRSLKRVADLSEEVRELYSFSHDVENLLSEFSRSVSMFLERLDVDHEKMDFVEKRLDLIHTLKRKYGGGIEEIVERLAEIEEEILALENIENEIEAARESLTIAQKNYDQFATRLSDIRREAGEKLGEKITEELRELNMPEAKLKIILEKGKRTAAGVDEVDILITTAVGHELRSLKKVVSGGELSRIMLAIQVIVGGDGTILFDEVDSGISGVTAGVVGEKLAVLAGGSQLICITHLPQMAVFADHHVLIEKRSDAHQTRTLVRELSFEERRDEIARLVGGVVMSEVTKNHSFEMMEAARRKKEMLRGEAF